MLLWLQHVFSWLPHDTCCHGYNTWWIQMDIFWGSRACEASLHNAYGLSRHGAPLRYVCGAAAEVRVRSPRKMFDKFYFLSSAFLQLSSLFAPVFYSQCMLMQGHMIFINNKVLNDKVVTMTTSVVTLTTHVVMCCHHGNTCCNHDNTCYNHDNTCSYHDNNVLSP